MDFWKIYHRFCLTCSLKVTKFFPPWFIYVFFAVLPGSPHEQCRSDTTRADIACWQAHLSNAKCKFFQHTHVKGMEASRNAASDAKKHAIPVFNEFIAPATNTFAKSIQMSQMLLSPKKHNTFTTSQIHLPRHLDKINAAPVTWNRSYITSLLNFLKRSETELTTPMECWTEWRTQTTAIPTIGKNCSMNGNFHYARTTKSDYLLQSTPCVLRSTTKYVLHSTTPYLSI